MTAKEKAKELVERFKDLRNYSSYAYSLCNATATQCAIIAVDEILKSIQTVVLAQCYGSAQFENPDIAYWQEVKNELNKL